MDFWVNIQYSVLCESYCSVFF